LVDTDELDLQGLEDTLQSIEAAIEDKVEGIIKVDIQMDAGITALAKEIKRLEARKKSMTAGKERLRGYTLSCLQAAGLQKVSTGVGIASVLKARESVQILDAEALPAMYRDIEIKPDKKAIGEAIKAGEQVPGAVMALGLPSLSIR